LPGLVAGVAEAGDPEDEVADAETGVAGGADEGVAAPPVGMGAEGVAVVVAIKFLSGGL
jgi:hypothetical protein